MEENTFFLRRFYPGAAFYFQGRYCNNTHYVIFVILLPVRITVVFLTIVSLDIFTGVGHITAIVFMKQNTREDWMTRERRVPLASLVVH